MSDAPQHCPACETEYVASARTCAECGGPLAPGPSPRYTGARTAPGTTSSEVATDAEAAHGGTFDALVTTLPGQQADQLVRMLLLEHIPSAIECDGVRKVYTEPPAQPYAVTLPVTVFVHAEDLEAAREIAASLESDDLIGDQWSDGAPSEEHEEPFSPDMTALDSDEPPPAPIEEPAPPPVAAAPLQPERSPLITLVIIAALALALYVAFLR